MSRTTEKQVGRIYETARMVQDIQERLFKGLSTELNDKLIEIYDEHDLLNKLCPWKQVTGDDLDHQVDLDKPARVLHKEPRHQPGVYVDVARGAQPTRMATAPRARIVYTQTTTAKYIKSLDELRNNPKMLDELAVGFGRDLGRDLTRKTLDSFDRVIGLPGDKVPETGEIQHLRVSAPDAIVKQFDKGGCKFVGTTDSLREAGFNTAHYDVVPTDLAPVDTIYIVPDDLLMAYEFLDRPELFIHMNGNDIEFYAWMSMGAVVYSVENLLRLSWGDVVAPEPTPEPVAENKD